MKKLLFLAAVAPLFGLPLFACDGPSSNYGDPSGKECAIRPIDDGSSGESEGSSSKGETSDLDDTGGTDSFARF